MADVGAGAVDDTVAAAVSASDGVLECSSSSTPPVVPCALVLGFGSMIG